MMAIGAVCQNWASLERLIKSAIHILSRSYHPAFNDATAWGVVDIIVAHADIRDRISIAKIFASQSFLGMPLYNRFEAHLNRIDNELRLERNRFIHDDWMVTEQETVRTLRRPKVVRPQAFQVEVAWDTSKTFERIEDVEAFATEIQDAISTLIGLIDEIEASYQQRFRRGEPPEPTLQG